MTERMTKWQEQKRMMPSLILEYMYVDSNFDIIYVYTGYKN